MYVRSPGERTRGGKGRGDPSDGARDADGLTICDLPLDSVNFLYPIYMYIRDESRELPIEGLSEKVKEIISLVCVERDSSAAPKLSIREVLARMRFKRHTIRELRRLRIRQSVPRHRAFQL